jgi:pimeloyl-ACP methyl ester carboxylesterase
MNLRKAVTCSAILAGALYAAFLCLIFVKQGSILYAGTINRVDPIAPHVEGADVLEIATPTGHVDAIFLAATATGGAAQKPVVIFGHGNGEVIDFWLTALDSFRERGVGVLLVEYPGYGRSTGVPSEASIGAAMNAAFDRIAADPRVDRTRIMGFGQSFGGGAICLLAKHRPLRALILQSTFPSLDIFPARYWALAFLLRDHFDSLSTLRQFSGPVLVIHGREDQLIPWQQAQRLATAAAHATFRLYNCGHGCWDPAHLPFWHDAEPFLVNAGILQPAPLE